MNRRRSHTLSSFFSVSIKAQHEQQPQSTSRRVHKWVLLTVRFVYECVYWFFSIESHAIMEMIEQYILWFRNSTTITITRATQSHRKIHLFICWMFVWMLKKSYGHYLALQSTVIAIDRHVTLHTAVSQYLWSILSI